MSERTAQFYIFIVVSLGLYALINYYVIRRGWRALAGAGLVRPVFLGVMITGALAFVAGRILVLRLPCLSTGIISAVGYWFMAFILYLFLLTLAVDLFRLADKIVPFFPAALRNPQTGGRILFGGVFGIAFVALAFGTIHAGYIRLQTVTVPIVRAAAGIPSLRAALISDVHVSPIIPASYLRRIVERVEALEPDIIFIGGDLFNEDTPADMAAEIGAVLGGLHPRYGVFACTGNHEYFGGIAKAREAFRAGGIRLLEDEAVLVADAFYVAGRKDRTAAQWGESRRPLEAILAGLDRGRPVILLDHQPVKLAEAAENGVDLQLSGHTHDGQIFPINIINKGIYELNWGLLKKGNTRYYVSSGAGTWGPRIRLGSTAEIVQLRIEFGKSAGTD